MRGIGNLCACKYIFLKSYICKNDCKLPENHTLTKLQAIFKDELIAAETQSKTAYAAFSDFRTKNEDSDDSYKTLRQLLLGDAQPMQAQAAQTQTTTSGRSPQL